MTEVVHRVHRLDEKMYRMVPSKTEPHSHL